MQNPEIVPLSSVDWPNHYRVIPSRFPTINFFEKIVDAHEMEAAFYLESLTNDRLREEVGDLSLVKEEDRLYGKGASVVMANFTHIGKRSRFSNGSYGVYYASRDLKTAVQETVYHREQFLSYTNESPGQIDMRVYVGTVLKPLHDIRFNFYDNLHDPNNYLPSQNFAAFLRARESWGLVYNSVRDKGGECIAVLRPPAVSIPTHSKHLVYVWDGQKIISVFEKSKILFDFGSKGTRKSSIHVV